MILHAKMGCVQSDHEVAPMTNLPNSSAQPDDAPLITDRESFFMQALGKDKPPLTFIHKDDEIKRYFSIDSTTKQRLYDELKIFRAESKDDGKHEAKQDVEAPFQYYPQSRSWPTRECMIVFEYFVRQKDIEDGYDQAECRL